MTPEDRQLFGGDGPDMWLSYPPLAGKHLRVADVQGAPDGTLALPRERSVSDFWDFRARSISHHFEKRNFVYSL